MCRPALCESLCSCAANGPGRQVSWQLSSSFLVAREGVPNLTFSLVPFYRTGKRADTKFIWHPQCNTTAVVKFYHIQTRLQLLVRKSFFVLVPARLDHIVKASPKLKTTVASRLFINFSFRLLIIPEAVDTCHSKNWNATLWIVVN